MKNKIIKRMKSILCMLLAVLMLFGTGTTTVYAVETLTGDENTSEDIYRWTRIKSIEQLTSLIKSTFVGDGKQASEMRLLLIPAVSHGDDEQPGFEEYYILNKSSNWCVDVSLSDNPSLKYESDEFFTRGAFRLPYLSYEGMNNSPEAFEAFGEAVPSFRIFEAGEDDKKTNELLRSAYSQYLQRQVIRPAGSQLDPNDSEIWEIGFPTTNYTTKLFDNIGNCAYREATKGLVTVGAYNGYEGKYYWLADDVISTVLDYQLVPNKYNGRYFDTVSEVFFKCYIGIKESKLETIRGDETVSVEKGAVKVLDKVSYIREGGVLQVQKGGTLFISGTCINNGTIQNNGGTIIVQKGALIMPLDPKDKESNTIGIIDVKEGEMIIREGARVINFENKENYYIKVGRNDGENTGGRIINRGIIASNKSIMLYMGAYPNYAPAILENYGYIYTGYGFKENVGTSGYDKIASGLSAKEYATHTTQHFESGIEITASNSAYVLTQKNISNGRKACFINKGVYKSYTKP